MATTRVRNYVKANAEVVADWKDKLLRTYFINLISASNVDGITLPDAHNNLTLYYLTRNHSRDNICRDVLYEHFELINGIYKITTRYGGVADCLNVDLSAALEAIKDIAVKPAPKVCDTSDVNASDVYKQLSCMSLANIAYIYHNQNEYDYIHIMDKNYTHEHYDPLRVGVIDVAMKDDADNIAFRNAVSAYYENETPLTASVVCGLDLPHLSRIKDYHHDSDHYDSYAFISYANSCLIPNVRDLTAEKIAFMKGQVKHGIDYLTAMLDEYSQLEDSILAADENMNGGFQELFYYKAIGNLYRNLPLLINSRDDADLKSLANRAAKKKYT